METEVVEFLSSLQSYGQKEDFQRLSMVLQEKSKEWISILQQQLNKDIWHSASLETQMTLIYILRLYFIDENRKRKDLSSWIEVIGQMLNTLNLSNHNQKEIKHLVKIMSGWGIRDKEAKNSRSVFTRQQCEEWSNSLSSRAKQIGIPSNSNINAITSAATGNNNSIHIPPSKPPSIYNNMSQASSAIDITNLPNTVTTSEHTIPHTMLNINTTPATDSLPLQPPSSNSILQEMHDRTLLALCQFQLQVFQSFQKGPVRRIDRWKMRIVLTTSYYLLHMYANNSNIVDVHGTALVVACIYLAGKAEYLFVKADKLRISANKFVRTLNEPPLLTCVQVYKYEAEMLRMLQYDVGTIPNPLRCLKALDMMNLQDSSRSSTSSSSVAVDGMDALCAPILSIPSIPNTPLTTSIDVATDKNNHTSSSSSSSSSSHASSHNTTSTNKIVVDNGIYYSTIQQCINSAVDVLLQERSLFHGKLLLIDDDYTLAAIILLQQIENTYNSNEAECEAAMVQVLSSFAHMSAALRHDRCVTMPYTGTASTMATTTTTSSSDSIMNTDHSHFHLIHCMKIFLAEQDNIKPLSQIFPISRRCIQVLQKILPNLRMSLEKEKYNKEHRSAIYKDKKAKAQIEALCEAVQQHNQGVHVPALVQWGKPQAHRTHPLLPPPVQQQQSAIGASSTLFQPPSQPLAPALPGSVLSHAHIPETGVSQTGVQYGRGFGYDRHHHTGAPSQFLPPPPLSVPIQSALSSDRSEIIQGHSQLLMLSTISKRESTNTTLSSSNDNQYIDRDNYPSTTRDSRDNYPSTTRDSRDNYPSTTRDGRYNYPSTTRDSRDIYPSTTRDNRDNYPPSSRNKVPHPNKDRDYDRKRCREEDRSWENNRGRDQGRGRDNRENDRNFNRYQSKQAPSVDLKPCDAPLIQPAVQESHSYSSSSNSNRVQTCAPCVSEYHVASSAFLSSTQGRSRPRSGSRDFPRDPVGQNARSRSRPRSGSRDLPRAPAEQNARSRSRPRSGSRDFPGDPAGQNARSRSRPRSGSRDLPRDPAEQSASSYSRTSQYPFHLSTASPPPVPLPLSPLPQAVSSYRTKKQKLQHIKTNSKASKESGELSDSSFQDEHTANKPVPELAPVSAPVNVLAPPSMPTVAPVSAPASVPAVATVSAPASMPAVDPVTAPASVPAVAPASAPASMPDLDPVTAPASVSAVDPVSAPASMPAVAPDSAPASVLAVAPVSVPASMPAVAPDSAPASVPAVAPASAPASMPAVAPDSAPASVSAVDPVSAPASMPAVAPVSAPASVSAVAPVCAPPSVPAVATVTALASVPAVDPVTAPASVSAVDPVTALASVPAVDPVTLPASVTSTAPVCAPATVPVSATDTPVCAPATVPASVTDTPVCAPATVPASATDTPVCAPATVPASATDTPVCAPATVPASATDTPVCAPTTVPTKNSEVRTAPRIAVINKVASIAATPQDSTHFESLNRNASSTSLVAQSVSAMGITATPTQKLPTQRLFRTLTTSTSTSTATTNSTAPTANCNTTSTTTSNSHSESGRIVCTVSTSSELSPHAPTQAAAVLNTLGKNKNSIHNHSNKNNKNHNNSSRTVVENRNTVTGNKRSLSHATTSARAAASKPTPQSIPVVATTAGEADGSKRPRIVGRNNLFLQSISGIRNPRK